MPFEITQNLPANPRVTVKFSGLMVFQPGADNTCDVGVHQRSPSHVFQVILVVNRPNQAATLIPVLTGPLRAPIVIRLGSTSPSAGDFKVFEKGTFTQTLQGSDRHDARWAINLQSPVRDIKVNEGAKPFVTLKTGVLFTPSLTPQILKPKFTRPPAAEMEIERFASELAVAIEQPGGGTKVILEWTDGGNQRSIALPLGTDTDVEDENTEYTLYFINEPPNFGSEPHDEMALYYQVLRRNGEPIHERDQCKLKFDMNLIRLDQMPCNPVRLDP